MGNVQIPEQLFFDVALWFNCPETRTADRESRITATLQKKIDALQRRKYYTDSKTADTEDEREAARLKYLDAVLMQQEYRY